MPTDVNSNGVKLVKVDQPNNAMVGLQKILDIDVFQIGKSFVESMFAAYHDKATNQYKESPFKPTDEIVLTQQQYKFVKGTINTTLGRLLFNRYVLERTGVIEHLGYQNVILNNKELENLSTKVNNLALENKITTETLAKYVDSRDALGFWCSAFLGCSITPALVRPMHDVNKRKAELFKQYEKELNSNNPVDQIMTASKIENELLDMVKTNMKKDPGWDMFASGVNNYSNNYKNINVMKGAIYNNLTKKYDVIQASCMDGTTKHDIPACANSVIAGAYPSAVGTAEAGYMSKKLLALLQSECIDPDPNSDCGTTSTIPFFVTKSNSKYVLYRYIQEGSKRVLITLDNKDSYIGKTIQLYSPQACTHDTICGKCGGMLFHVLGSENIGMLTSVITQKMLNIKLKSKHDLSQSAGIIPSDWVFLHKNDFYTVDNALLRNKLTMKMFIPRSFEKSYSFFIESTTASILGVFPVKFYDKNDQVVLSTMMIIPTIIEFNIYSDIQEDTNYYIITYEPNSDITILENQKTIANVDAYINCIYFNSSIQLIPYKLQTELMFRCLELNGQDLTGPSIVYELMSRRLCRSGDYSFAKVYGKDPNVDQMSYTKFRFDDAVRDAGILQGVLFQNVSKSIVVGLSQSLNGKKPEDTPLEKIIKA